MPLHTAKRPLGQHSWCANNILAGRPRVATNLHHFPPLDKTGNITQLSMSAAKLVFTHPSPPESVKRLSQSSSAVLGFIVGSYLASLIDAQFHSKHRGKLFVTAIVRSFVSALVAFFIALIGWDGCNGYVGMALLFVVGWLSFESVLPPPAYTQCLHSWRATWARWPSTHLDWAARPTLRQSYSHRRWPQSSVTPPFPFLSVEHPRFAGSALQAWCWGVPSLSLSPF